MRIWITGARPRAVRARGAERYLTGKEPWDRNLAEAASWATAGIDFLSDLQASGEYRQDLTRVFTAKALAQAVTLGAPGRRSALGARHDNLFEKFFTIKKQLDKDLTEGVEYPNQLIL